MNLSDIIGYLRRMRHLCLAAAIVLPLHTVWAETEHREGCLGRIAQPACNADGTPVRQNLPYVNRSAVAHPNPPHVNPLYKAALTDQSFQKLNGSLGEWSGVVSGNGDVHLVLQILSHGNVTSTRYIGNVMLVNRSTTFHFRSAVPPSGDWNWKIVAFAHPAPSQKVS